MITASNALNLKITGTGDLRLNVPVTLNGAVASTAKVIVGTNITDVLASTFVLNGTLDTASAASVGPPVTTGSIAESVLQVGKFLTPQLYFSYGWSPFNDSHLFKIRYNITKQWEIESSAGTEASGGDIFYRIEFD